MAFCLGNSVLRGCCLGQAEEYSELAGTKRWPCAWKRPLQEAGVT